MRRQFWSTVIVSLVLLAADLAYTPGCLVGSLLIDVALGLCWICFACSACRFDLLFALGLGLHLMLGHSCCNLLRVTQRTASLLCVAWVVLRKCSTSPPAVTRLTVYCRPNMLDASVLAPEDFPSHAASTAGSALTRSSPEIRFRGAGWWYFRENCEIRAASRR